MPSSCPQTCCNRNASTPLDANRPLDASRPLLGVRGMGWGMGGSRAPTRSGPSVPPASPLVLLGSV